MYSSGGENRNLYQQQQEYQNRNNQIPAVGSDYGYGGGINRNLTYGGNSGSYDTSSVQPGVDSGHSGNVPFYTLPNSNCKDAGGSSSGRNTNYNTNYNSNSNYNSNYSGGGYSQSQYSAAYQTQSVQSNSENYSNNHRKQSGWVKKDSLKRTTPYSGAKGTNMMQKMGWNPGQSLGKRQNGQLEPHMPDIKVNRRGFDVAGQNNDVTMHNNNNKKIQIGPKPVKVKPIVIEGKNPICVLEEYSSKKKISPPRYETIVDEGPIHDKTFVFKVVVDGVEYSADKGGKKKKDAKAEAARQCLIKLGLLTKPTEV